MGEMKDGFTCDLVCLGNSPQSKAADIELLPGDCFYWRKEAGQTFTGIENPLMLVYDNMVSLTHPNHTWNVSDGSYERFGLIKKWVVEGNLVRLPRGTVYRITT